MTITGNKIAVLVRTPFEKIVRRDHLANAFNLERIIKDHKFFVDLACGHSGNLSYPGDPEMMLLAETRLRNEIIRFYDCAWLAIIRCVRRLRRFPMICAAKPTRLSSFKT